MKVYVVEYLCVSIEVQNGGNDRIQRSLQGVLVPLCIYIALSYLTLA